MRSIPHNPIVPKTLGIRLNYLDNLDMKTLKVTETIDGESYSIKPESYQISGGGKITAAQHHVYYHYSDDGVLVWKTY